MAGLFRSNRRLTSCNVSCHGVIKHSLNFRRMFLNSRPTHNEPVMEDEDEYVPTLEGQFASFAKMLDWFCPRETISLYCSDYWMRQSNIIDDRQVTMIDTGVAWCKFSKAELDWDEWRKYLAELCAAKELNNLEIDSALTNCGLPGATRVNVPQYRDFFNTYKSKKALLICESLDSCGKPKKKPKPT